MRSFENIFRGICLRDTVGETGFLVHSLGDGNIDFLSVIKVCADFVAEFAFGKLDVVLGGTFAGHQVEETIINVNLSVSVSCHKGYQLEFSADNVRDIHVVGGRAEIFQFLLGEDLLSIPTERSDYINANQMDLGVTVLSSLRGTHINNLN